MHAFVLCMLQWSHDSLDFFKCRHKPLKYVMNTKADVVFINRYWFFPNSWHKLLKHAMKPNTGVVFTKRYIHPAVIWRQPFGTADSSLIVFTNRYIHPAVMWRQLFGTVAEQQPFGIIFNCHLYFITYCFSNLMKTWRHVRNILQVFTLLRKLRILK